MGKGQGVYAPIGLVTAAGAGATTDTFDCAAGNCYRTPAKTANLALTVVNMQSGVFYSVEFTQDATGGRTLTFPGLTWSSFAPQIDARPNATTSVVFGYLRPGVVTLISCGSTNNTIETNGVDVALVTSPIGIDVTLAPGYRASSGASAVARKNFKIDTGKIDSTTSTTLSEVWTHPEKGIIQDRQLQGTAGSPDTNLIINEAFGNLLYYRLQLGATVTAKEEEALGANHFYITLTGASSDWQVRGPAGTFMLVTQAGVVTLGRVNTDVLLLKNKTQTTIGAAGGAAALPATPLGYLNLNINGTEVVLPYYNRV